MPQSPADPTEPTESDPITPLPSAPLRLSPAALRALELRCQSDVSRYESIFEPLRTKAREWRDFLDGNIQPTWTPFRDSSKVFIPLPRLVKAAAHSRIWQTIFQQKDVVVVESPMQESEAELAGFDLHGALKALQRCLNELCLDEQEFNLKEACDSILHETTTIGTAPVRVFHDYWAIPKKRYNSSGELETDRHFIERDRVGIEVLPIETCLWDISADTNSLRLFGHQFGLSRTELNVLSDQQKWYPAATKLILDFPDSAPSTHLADTHRREHLASDLSLTEREERLSSSCAYTFYELYYRNTDVDNDGIYEDIVVTFHPASGKVVRVILWPYIHNQLPVVLVNYEQTRARPVAQGVIEPITPLCAGINAIANQTINSHTIRDNPIIVVPEGSEAEAKLEAGIVPGLVLGERVKGEIHTLEFGQAGNTQVSLLLLDKLFDIAFLVNHLGPPQMGDVSAARRAPGGLGMSILQQGAELIDKIINRFRVSLGRIILQAFAILWQTNRGKIVRIVGQADADAIAKLLNKVGIDHLRVTLAVTSATHSRELDRQNYLAMIQTVLGYERQVLELVKMMQGGTDPKSGMPIPPDPLFNSVATEVLRTSQTMMMRYIESFPQVTDASAHIPDTATIIADATASMARIQEQLGVMGGGGPTNPAAAPMMPSIGPEGAIGPGAGAVLGGF